VIFVLEQWSEKRQAWIATGNVRRTRKAAGELLLGLNARSPNVDRQIQPYERKPDKKQRGRSG
jgi:hypothetical protein